MIEDEPDLAEVTIRGLEEEGFSVAWANRGETARRFLDQNWDLVLLDLMLPDMSGEGLLNYIKQRQDPPPVLVLTAKANLNDKLTLFRQGCDDYLTKPFAFEELLVRIHALLRRSQKIAGDVFQYQDLTLDNSQYRLTAGGDGVGLTPKEAAICRLLLSHAGKVVSRKAILEGVWGLKEEPTSNLVGIHVFKLRRKLEQLGRGPWFRTVRAAGFMIAEPGHESPEREPHGP